MKLLITGANGQVGSELQRLGKARGYEIVATDSNTLDITSEEAVAGMIGECAPQVVINSAAYTAVDAAETDQAKAKKVNVDGPANLAKACSEKGIPLLHISTDYVFDGVKEGEYLESDSVAPTSVYGQTKLDGDLAVIGGTEHHVIVRVSWVFGATGHNFVKTMLRLAESRDELGVVDDQFGAPTSAVSIARTLLDIVELPGFGKDDFPWGVYHLPSNPGVTWHGFASEIFKQAKMLGLIDKEMKVNPIGSEEFPTPVKRPANSKLGSEKLSQLIEVSECDWRADLVDVLKAL